MRPLAEHPEEREKQVPGDGLYIIKQVTRHEAYGPTVYMLILGCPYCSEIIKMEGYADERVIKTSCAICNKEFMIYRNMVQQQIGRQRGDAFSPDHVEVVKDGVIPSAKAG